MNNVKLIGFIKELLVVLDAKKEEYMKLKKEEHPCSEEHYYYSGQIETIMEVEEWVKERWVEIKSDEK